MSGFDKQYFVNDLNYTFGAVRERLHVRFYVRFDVRFHVKFHVRFNVQFHAQFAGKYDKNVILHPTRTGTLGPDGTWMSTHPTRVLLEGVAHLITEAKQCWVRTVLGWETTRMTSTYCGLGKRRRRHREQIGLSVRRKVAPYGPLPFRQKKWRTPFR